MPPNDPSKPSAKPAGNSVPEILWRPSPSLKNRTPIDLYRQHVNRQFHLSLTTSHQLHHWTVTHPQQFWLDLYGHLDLIPVLPSHITQAYDDTVPMSSVPKFFEGVDINYAENVLRHGVEGGQDAERVALVDVREGQELGLTSSGKLGDEDRLQGFHTLTWRQLREQVRVVSNALRAAGVAKGDVVAALVGNSIRAVVMFLSTATVGGVFTSISPDLGIEGCVARLQQVTPKILFADASTTYKGRHASVVEKVGTVYGRLKRKPRVFVYPVSAEDVRQDGWFETWEDFVGLSTGEEIRFERVPFSYPLVICYTSGTTGMPKCIVHQHGLILQLLKISRLHNSLRPGEVVMQFSSTSWVLFYIMNGHLATGATTICYDGSPMYPDVRQLVRILARFKATYFGTSPRYLHELDLAGVKPAQEFDLSALRMVNTTGATLSPSQYRYFYANFPPSTHLSNSAGGTDTATSLIAADPAGPLRIGEMQMPSLGIDVDVADPATGASIKATGRPGEMVIRKPFPSMPPFFWGDEGNKIYRAAYFERFPDIDVWAQHDWLSFNPKTGGSMMHGRSDGVLNPSGIRFGSGEIYAIVESARFTGDEGIADTLCVGRRRPKDTDETVFLFVKMKDGRRFTKELEGKIRDAVRQGLSPRHVPRFIVPVDELPVTVNGKKVETAVKQIISGKKIEVSSTVANPECLLGFSRFVRYGDRNNERVSKL